MSCKTADSFTGNNAGLPYGAAIDILNNYSLEHVY